MKTKTPTLQRPSTVIYAGPRIPGVAESYAVFNNGIPKTLAKLAGKSKAFNALIVPVSELKTVQQEFKNSASTYSYNYKQAQKELKGGINNGL